MPRPTLIALLFCLAIAAPALGAAPLWTHNGTEPVRAVALSSDGETVAVASDYLHIFNRTGGLLATSWPARDVAVAPYGDLIVSGTDDTIYAYGRDGSELWSRPNETAALAVSADGATVAALGRYGDLAVYDGNGEPLGTAPGEEGEGVGVATSEDGSVVVAACEKGVAACSQSADQLWADDLPSPYAIAVSPSGGLVAVGDAGSVKFYNGSGDRVGEAPAGGAVRSLAMAAPEGLTVAGAEEGGLLVLDPDGTVEWKRTAGGGVTRVAASESGSVIAAGAGDGTLLVYDRDGILLWQAPLAGEVRALALSADGTTLAAGCDDGTVYLFETGAGGAGDRNESANASSGAPDGTAPGNATAGEDGENGTVDATGVADPDAGVNVTAEAGENVSGAGTATDANASAAANRTASVDVTATGNGTPAGNRTAGVTATVSPSGTPSSGVPLVLPALALVLVAAWAGLLRRE